MEIRITEVVQLPEELENKCELLFYYLHVVSTLPTAYVYGFIGFSPETKVTIPRGKEGGETEYLNNKAWLY